MPLNLDPMKAFVEGEMLDDFLIDRDPEGYRDNTFNETTGIYTGPARSTVYSGKGIVAPITSSPTETPEGGGQASYNRYNLMIPLDSDEPHVDDRVTIVNCVRDPALNGREFYVESVQASSFQVMRMLLISERKVTSNI